MKRAAVFGSHGQLGIELSAALSARNFEVASFDRASVDITDPAAVEKAISRYSPSFVLNAAAYNQVDLAETDPATAFAVNALAVRNLALSCRAAGAQLVHFSTDYVFDGIAEHPHAEDEPTHPAGAYAVSKLAGELYALAYLDHPLIIRTSGVFGPAGRHTARGNFVELMLRLASQNQPIRVVEDFIASPTYAPALASRTVDLLDRGITGVLHIGGGTPISWYDWAVRIFTAAGPDLSHQARPKPTHSGDYRTAARRPKYSALSNRKMESLGLAPMPSLDHALRDYFERRAASSVATAGMGARAMS